MRILLALESCGGGAGRHVIDLANGLLAKGHDVSLIYSSARAEPWFVAAIDAMPSLTAHELPMQRSVGPGDWTTLRALKKLIRDEGPFDILHGHSSKAGALLRLASDGSDATRIYTPHAPITMDPALSTSARFLYGSMERWLARRCERIICVSRDERDHLEAVGLPPEKLRVVYNGIAFAPPADRAAIRQRLELETGTVCFGFVGRLSHQKAVHRAILAFAMLRARTDDARLVIVGDGPERNRLESLAKKMGVFRQVTFTGHADGAELMAAFDVFLLPSRYEGMPYVLIEAVGCGLPIIVTDVGGAHVVVKNGDNGFVLPRPSIELLAERMADLAVQPELRRTMSRRSAQIATQFTSAQMIERTIRAYTEVVSEPSARGLQYQ
jgi:glycosyltransferase involved in cell wall biosynthesis